MLSDNLLWELVDGIVIADTWRTLEVHFHTQSLGLVVIREDGLVFVDRTVTVAGVVMYEARDVDVAPGWVLLTRPGDDEPIARTWRNWEGVYQIKCRVS
jgi:hypothetical protein